MMSEQKQNKNKKIKQKSFDFKNRMKVNSWNRKQYKIFASKQFIGMIMVAMSVLLFVFSFISIPGFSTINGYTFGMLFGYYSYFFYIGFIILGLSYLFQIDVKVDKFIATKYNRKIYFSWFSYIFLSLGIALVAESIIFLVRHNGRVFPEFGAFEKNFSAWWNIFTNNGDPSKAALPNVLQSQGVIISLFMSMIVSWSGCIVSIILGLVFILYFAYFTLYGSITNRLRFKVNNENSKKNKMDKEEFEDYKTKILDLSFEDNAGVVEKPNLNMLSNINPKTTTISIDNPDVMFPIDNPFQVLENEENTKSFIEDKTSEVNLENKLTTEFKLDFHENKIVKQNIDDIKTFDFELDLFKTSVQNPDQENDDISMKTNQATEIENKDN